MKTMHLSDLHLGKTIHEYSMIEDQEYILKNILQIVDAEKVNTVFISGDIYDRTVAPTEALRLFDDFLDGLVRRSISVFIVSGNHDSAERIAFGSRLLNHSGVYIAPVFDGTVSSYTVSDSNGDVNVYLLPFLKPAHIKRYFPDAFIETWTDAIRVVIDSINLDPAARNVLLAHQFVTGAATCDSEELSVGGQDNVDVEVFDKFDYVALGHLHGPQSIGRPTVRYCGTPLKYSFSEANHKKTVTIAEVGKKGNVDIHTIPLTPKRDLRVIKGTYLELTAKSFVETQKTDDYLNIILTDEDDQPDAISKLRYFYPNLMKLEYDNTRTKTKSVISNTADTSLTPIELFQQLFVMQNGSSINDDQRSYLKQLIEEVWEDIYEAA